MNPPIAYLSLGSNLGNSVKFLRQALNRLQALAVGPLEVSSFWQTTPVDCPPGSPPFVNAVAGLPLAIGTPPEALLQALQQMEIEFGRRPKQVLNEPRPLDLDLLCLGAEIRNTPQLVLPHPRAHLRRFVLQPWSELAPDLILPGKMLTIRELLAALPGDASEAMRLS